MMNLLIPQIDKPYLSSFIPLIILLNMESLEKSVKKEIHQEKENDCQKIYL